MSEPNAAPKRAIELIVSDMMWNRYDDLMLCGKDDDCHETAFWIKYFLGDLAIKYRNLGGTPEGLEWTRESHAPAEGSSTPVADPGSV